MSFPSLLHEAWRGVRRDMGLGRLSSCFFLSCDPGTRPHCFLACLISVNSGRSRLLTLNLLNFHCGFSKHLWVFSIFRSLIIWQYIFFKCKPSSVLHFICQGLIFVFLLTVGCFVSSINWTCSRLTFFFFLFQCFCMWGRRQMRCLMLWCWNRPQ